MNHAEYLEMTIGDILSRLARIDAISDEITAWPAGVDSQETRTDTQIAGVRTVYTT
ncbi:MAG: hypothetical protein ACYCYO_08300 [Bacilli bacterium]